MRFTVFVAALVCLCTSAGWAFTVDQHNDQVSPNSYWNTSNTPTGQEFRPAVDHFDVAELYVKCMSDITYPTEFVVEVYEWDASGSPLSVSDSVPAAADYIGPLFFTFPGSVALIPSATYVLVIHELGGTGWGLGCTSNRYYWGALVRYGIPDP
jgi:hypothetical protein